MRTSNAQSVEEIINKYIAGRGGIDKLNSIKSILMEGTTNMKGNQFKVKIRKVQGRFFRRDMEFGGNTGYTIITEKSGWNYSSMDSYVADEIPQGKLESFKNELDIVGPLINYRSKGYKATLLGKDFLYERECYKILLTSLEGKESFHFIDCKTYLLLQSRQKIESKGKIYGNSPEIVTNFRDYKICDEVLFPQIISTEGFGIASGIMLFHTIEVNIPVDEKLYKPGN